MSKYFDWPSSLKRLIRFDAARAEDVNDALDELTAGLDTLDVDVDRAIKLPSGASDQTLSLSSGQRANLLLAFDASGDITAVAGGGRSRGDWATATDYVISDYFRDPVSKNIYSVLEAHTSGVLANDIAAGKVQLVIDVADVELAKTAAEAAALAAAGQVTLAAGQVTLAAGQVSLATTQAGVATTQAGIATGAAGTATTQAGVATTQAINAAGIYENFDKRYLGAKASDPALDNQGAALTAGALYFNTSVNEMRSWNGSAWEAAYLPASGYVTEAPSDGNRYARKNTGWEMTGVVQRSARTSNTELSAADGGKRIDITSGTFTQTFAAATTLGDGWWCYLGNSGTGDITLTPSGAETIDGLSSYVMYPGEVRLVQCDGTTLRTVVVQSFNKTFTASGNFIKPPSYSMFGVAPIGGGSGGQCGGRVSSASTAAGGNGGAAGGRGEVIVPASAISATAAVVVGAGGAGAAGRSVNGSPVDGSAGGSSSLAGVITATGAATSASPGYCYMATVANTGGAGGAGASANVSGAAGGNAVATLGGSVVTGGGGGGSCFNGTSSVDGGAGGAYGIAGEALRAGGAAGVGASAPGGPGANNLFLGGTGSGGGAGGGASGTAGGAGGAGGTGAGGGGGGGCNGATSGAGGAGGAGAVTIWGVI